MKRFALIGHPVAHSVSPAIHRAAHRELGISASYELVDCPDRAAVERVFAALGRGELDGLNVTLPWKQLALELADHADPVARKTGAANVVAHSERGLTAHNTDVAALAQRIRQNAPNARSALVIGSGGAALAVVAALGQAGIERVTLTARRFRGDLASWPNAERLRSLGAMLTAWPSDDDAPWWEMAAGSDVCIQATSAGMHGADPGEAVRDVIPWDRLAPGAWALDVVYTPSRTPFLDAAEAAGLRAEGGLPMLVGQAESAIELWIGRRPPPEPLLEAALAALEAA